jgi:hypothetical protein
MPRQHARATSVHVCTDLSFGLHRRHLGCVDNLLCKLRHGQQRPVSLGDICSKQRGCAMPASHRHAELHFARLPCRLLDGGLASVELLLCHVWDRSAATVQGHHSSHGTRRQRMLRHDRGKGVHANDVPSRLRCDVMESVGHLHCAVQSGQLTTLSLCQRSGVWRRFGMPGSIK